MKNWYQNLISEYPFLKFLGSRYTLVLVFFIIWMLFLDNYSYLDHRVLDKQINALEDNKDYYQEEIAKDEQSIKNLKNPGQTERYAREKYFMKKDSEDIYIIDIEEDRINDSLEGAKQ
jgi:cell division protein FtsB